MATTMGHLKDAAESGPVRKKIKTTDLALSSATRATIDGLTHTFKRNGGYDSVRKRVWDDLENSVCFSAAVDIYGLF
jgi:hypothetical protein